jgi:hypothetical protein
MAELPEDSPYRRTVYRSFWSVMRELWNDPARRESRLEQPAQAA